MAFSFPNAVLLFLEVYLLKTKKLIALVATMFILPIQAAELSAQSGISILYINGQSAEEKIGTNIIEDGFTQVVIKLDDKLGRGGSAKVFTSKPYLLNFDANGSKVELKAPKLYSTVEAKEEFKKEKPGWKVLIDGKEINFEQQMLPGKKGFMPYAGMENLVAEHNKQNGIYFKNGQLIDKPVAVEVAAATTVATAGASEKVAPVTTQATKNVEQLKAWYLQASKQERKEFRRWMIDQE